MICEACGAKNVDEAEYCESCGNRMPVKKKLLTDRICDSCGAKNVDEAEYCEVCGNHLPIKKKLLTDRICTACGAKNAESVEICEICGNRMAKKGNTLQTQIFTDLISKNKSLINKKTILIAGIVAIVVIAAAVLLTSGVGGGLSGKYYASDYGDVDYDEYISFSGNSFKIYSSGRMVLQGTYSLSGNSIRLMATNPEDSHDTASIRGTVSTDKRTLSIEGTTLVKK
ncbi:MAG: zinc ribbon domain-containing protein [Candidatus Bathyarchaeota archaeon]|uniref:double zinc ribbon domain-containing protein n=1 Tax=Candidatus Bathycorpusculum sp. TaxID=2994959 RepID=UPI00282A1B7C|nr:zinc ribbon domain-containing protein [Candidatus Termiticorpusculum sp.]MCL2292652.1 zinc ribbon domain-containing protein [Candidatus Termiticorpusculum sp.]